MAEDTKRETQTSVRTVPPPGSTAPTARVEDRSEEVGERRPARRDTGGSTAVGPHTGNGRPSNPDEMRAEIERTRSRMSSTLDALEARIAFERDELDRKKDAALDRLTLKGPREKLSRQPWKSIAIAFVAGYVVAAIRD